MSVSSFHEILFPEDISYGSSGGPGFNTTVIELSSGHEQRNINWSRRRRPTRSAKRSRLANRWKKSWTSSTLANGKAYGFRFKDWMDYQLVHEPIAVGDGVTRTFQVDQDLRAEGFPFVRRSASSTPAPSPSTSTRTRRAGSPCRWTTTPASSRSPPHRQWASRHRRRRVPRAGPLRHDEIKINHDDWELMSWPSIPLVEIKPRMTDGTII
jgi:hypothetical protein